MHSRSEWLAARGKVPNYLAEVKLRADKQVAHLTKKRFADDAPEKVWRPGLEIAAILPGFRLFLEHADSSLLSPRVSGAVGALAALVEVAGEA